MLYSTFTINKIIFTFLVVASLSSCVATKNSNKQEAARLSIKIERNPEAFKEAFKNSEGQDRILTTAPPFRGVLNEVVPLVFEGVKQLIKKDQEKYNSEIYQNIETNYFYNKLSNIDPVDPRGMQVNNIIITRTFWDKKIDESVTAYTINLEVDKDTINKIINNSMFTLKINEIDFPYFQAKVPDTKWYLPWTYIFKKKTNQVNIDLELTLKGTWKDQSGNIHINEQVGKFVLLLRDVPVDDEKRKAYFENMKNQPIEGYSFLIPRSSGYYITDNKEVLPAFGFGNFNIEVIISESSNHKFVTQKLQENSDAIFTEIKNQLTN